MSFGGYRIDGEVVIHGWLVLIGAAIAMWLVFKLVACSRCEVCGRRSVFMGQCTHCGRPKI